MELPIEDKSLALEMAYAEKPYREMAKIALNYTDARVRDESLRLARLGIAASTEIYYEGMEKRRTDALYAEAQLKNINAAAYIETGSARKYVNDLREFSLNNITLMAGQSRAFTNQAVAVAKTLVLAREGDFRYIEKQAGVGYQGSHYIGTQDLSTKMEWLEDTNNWQHIEKNNGSLLLSYTRHVLGFRLASYRASERSAGQIPFFDDIPVKYQKEAYDRITDEWLAYVNLVIDYGATDKISGKSRPLLYNPASMLSEALREERQAYASMTDSEIIDAFENSTDFHGQCRWIMNQKEQKRQRSLEKETRRNISKKIALPATLKGEILNYRLDDEEQQNFVSTADLEVVLPIHDTANIEKVLKALAKKHAIEMGEQYGEYVGGRDLFAGFKLEFGEGVRPKGFNGRVEDIRMRHLPLTEEFIESFIKKRKLEYLDDFAVVARIGVFSDLHSTGRGKIGEAMQEYVLQGRNIQNPHSRNIRITKLANLSGDKLVEYLNQESDKVAFTVKRRNMLNPISGGLPSLGKQR